MRVNSWVVSSRHVARRSPWGCRGDTPRLRFLGARDDQGARRHTAKAHCGLGRVSTKGRLPAIGASSVGHARIAGPRPSDDAVDVRVVPESVEIDPAARETSPKAVPMTTRMNDDTNRDRPSASSSPPTSRPSTPARPPTGRRCSDTSRPGRRAGRVLRPARPLPHLVGPLRPVARRIRTAPDAARAAATAGYRAPGTTRPPGRDPPIDDLPRPTTGTGPGTMAPRTQTCRAGRGSATSATTSCRSEIGRGGMGVVYKARQLSLNRLVALKMILAGPWPATPTCAASRPRPRRPPASTIPNIVPIYEVGEHDGQPYFSMKLVEGGSLAERLGRRPARSPRRGPARRRRSPGPSTTPTSAASSTAT